MDDLYDYAVNMAWKGGEAGYCLALLVNEGDDNVPRGSVDNYLMAQVSDGSCPQHLMEALRDCISHIEEDRWPRAVERLARVLTCKR